MNERVGPAEIGTWYARADKGEQFQVVGRDEFSRTIEIQLFDGDLDEIEEDTWNALQLERRDPPEDWTGPVEVEADDLGYSETAMAPGDWIVPLQPLQAEGESWEDVTVEEERDALDEVALAEAFAVDIPAA